MFFNLISCDNFLLSLIEPHGKYEWLTSIQGFIFGKMIHQGFVSKSLDDDLSFVRKFIAYGREVFVVQSYNKNLNLLAKYVAAINTIISFINLTTMYVLSKSLEFICDLY